MMAFVISSCGNDKPSIVGKWRSTTEFTKENDVASLNTAAVVTEEYKSDGSCSKTMSFQMFSNGETVSNDGTVTGTWVIDGDNLKTTTIDKENGGSEMKSECKIVKLTPDSLVVMRNGRLVRYEKIK